MKPAILILLFLGTLSLSAQIDTTRKEFYPMQVGNLWQYRNEHNNLYTIKITGDTIMFNNRYYIFSGGILRTVYSHMRIDSLMRVELGSPEDPCVLYRLGEEAGSFWEPCFEFYDLPTKEPFIRCEGITTGNIFGELREMMSFSYGGVHPGFPGDTIWFNGAVLVRGIGILTEQYYEGEYRFLQGAIIDGVQYGTIVSIDEPPLNIPMAVALHRNYPNPFNPTTTIEYELPREMHASLKVYDLLGREVAVLADRHHSAGRHEATFDAAQLSSGLYIYRLTTAEVNLTGRMLLVK